MPPPLTDVPRSMPRMPFPSALRQFGSQPIYRVIEVTRDASGRLNLQGRIWHSDLERLRRFGRALAANSQSHRVVIADSRGELVEEIDLAGPDERRPLWGQWQRIPLPPAPPRRAAPPVPPRLAPAPRPPAPPATPVQAAPAPGTPPRDLPRLSADVPGAKPPAEPGPAD